MKKAGIMILVLALALMPQRTFAVDYASNEDYWKRVCNGKISEDLLASCQGYYNYLEQKANNMQNDLSDIDAKIDAIQGDIDQLFEVLKGIQAQIDEKDSEIQSLMNQITVLEQTITQLEEDIETKEKDIEIRDQQIKSRMVETQTFNNSFGYIDFLMGATDFVDLIRRFSVMNQITSFEQAQIQQLNDDILQLDLDKQEIVIQKQGIEAQKAVIDQAKAELEEYKTRQNSLISQQREKEADLMEEYARMQSTIDSIRNNMPVFSVGDDSLTSSSGFGRVVTGYRSAGTWYYPASFGGGRHAGLDLAGPRGTPVTSPFNGIIAIAQNITSVEGTKNPATGNNVMIIGNVNGTTYAIHLLHLQYNSIVVKPGEVVVQGQTVAARGSTGNSTGPHVHIDLYNLGSMSVEAAYNYVRSTGNATFGMSYHAYGWECSNKAPICRERPEDKIPY